MYGMPVCLPKFIDVKSAALLHEMIGSSISKLLDYFLLAIAVGS